MQAASDSDGDSHQGTMQARTHEEPTHSKPGIVAATDSRPADELQRQQRSAAHGTAGTAYSSQPEPTRGAQRPAEATHGTQRAEDGQQTTIATRTAHRAQESAEGFDQETAPTPQRAGRAPSRAEESVKDA